MVKIYNDKTKSLVHHYETNQSEANWDEVEEIGYKGKHGKWIPAWVTLDGGQLIYVDGADTYKGRPSHRARGWFRANPDVESVIITAPDYAGRGLRVIGKLERLSYSEMKKLDLPVKIRSSKWLKLCKGEQI
jgi:hypothetical protein